MKSKGQILGFVFLLMGFSVGAQNLFNRTYGAYGAFNQGAAAVEISDKGFLILGSTGGWESQNGDMVVIKTDSLGEQQWFKLFGGAYSDQAADLLRLESGNILVCGNTATGLDGDYNVRFLLINENGDVLWEQNVGSSEWDFFRSAAELSDGSVVICLQTFGGESSNGNMQLLRLSADGSVMWNEVLPGNEAQRAGGVCVMDGDTLVMVGSRFNPANNSNDYHLSWWTADGELIQERTHAFAEDDHLVGLLPVPGGDLFVVGNTLLGPEQYQTKIHLMDRQSGDMLTTFSSSSDPGLSFEIRDLAYLESENAFVVAINYKDNTLIRAAAFRFTPDPILQCTFVYPGADNSDVSTIAVASDGFGFVGTSMEFAPGQTSIAFSKADFDCNNVPVQVGVEQAKTHDQRFTAYPNPSETGLFGLTHSFQAAYYQVTGIDGKVILQGQISGNATTVDLSNAAPGLYQALFFDVSGLWLGRCSMIKP